MNLAGSSIGPAGDPAEGTFLEADDARGTLFDEILEQLALCDLFSNPAPEPTIFPVYAHRNDAVGIAHEDCVHDLIRWFQKIKARVLSDKSAMPPLVCNEEDSSAQRNILANQIRLLPFGTSTRLHETATSIDKVIVCGSEVLKQYCETSYALNYIMNVVELCKGLVSQPVMTVKSRIEEFVHGETLNDGFHHVLTEIAFLKVRRLRLADNHGMIPVALDGGHHMPYLSVFGDTDLTLKLKSPTPAAKHALFFKLLEQVFVERKDLAKDCKDCYDDVVEELRLSETGRVSKASFEICFRAKMTKTYYKHWSTFSTVLRKGQYVAYAGKLGERTFQIQEKDKEKERRKILRWVSPMAAAPMHGKYRDGDTKRLEGTCDWVIHDEEFLQWHKSENSAILSLCGSMGMGKTYATSRVIDWVKCSLEGSKYQEALVYFYCIEQDEERNKAKPILRSIVRQVATGPWNQRDELIAMDKAVIDIWNKHISKDQFYDTFDEWETCLLKLLTTYPRTTIVLDALDECGPNDRKQLVELFNTLTTRLSNVKIFISTRPESDLSEWLSQHSTISIHNGRTARDISAFVEKQIAQHDEWPHMSVELKEHMMQTLITKSQGMFLCARLQMENLQECSFEEDIRDGLENLPQTLIALYEKLYLRPLKPAAKKLRDKALRWVICSEKPWTVDELLFAICQDPEADHVTATRADVSERLIFKLCNNFLSLDPNGDEHGPPVRHLEGPTAPVWRLAHQAVAEFFEKSDCCSQERAEMHYEAGKVCLMILLDTFKRTAIDDKNGFHERIKSSLNLQCPRQPALQSKNHRSLSATHFQFKKPLVDYATHAWPTHVLRLQHREDSGVARLSLRLQQFLGEPEKGSLAYERWLKHAYETSPPPGTSVLVWRIFRGGDLPFTWRDLERSPPIGLLCYLGIYTIPTEWWDCSNFNWNIRFTFSPMNWFPRGHYGDSLCTTLSRVRNGDLMIKCRCGDEKQWKQYSLCSLVALACVHEETTTLTRLLDRGAQIDTTDEGEVHPMTVAIRNKSMKVMQLLQNEGSLELAGVESGLASVEAADLTSADSILGLLDIGVSINTPLQDGTLLAAATLKGWDNLVISWLLTNGADLSKELSGTDFESAVYAARERLDWTDEVDSSWPDY